MTRLIVIDEGNVLHRAAFSYLAQYKELIKTRIYKLHPEWKRENEHDLIESQNWKDVWEEARKYIDIGIQTHQIFIMPPTCNFMRMCISYLKKLQVTPEDRIILAFDYGKSWRKDIDRAYKSQRKGLRESKADKEWWDKLYESFNKFFDDLEPNINFNFIKIWRIEADDVASVAVRLLSGYDEKILISTDKDWEMLCQIPGVRIWSPLKKGKNQFKDVPNPMKVLLEKIQGDVSDNLLTKPSSEAEFERRKKIVNLLELPFEIEQPIKEALQNMPLKNLNIPGLQYKSVRNELYKLYNPEKKNE